MALTSIIESVLGTRPSGRGPSLRRQPARPDRRAGDARRALARRPPPDRHRARRARPRPRPTSPVTSTSRATSSPRSSLRDRSPPSSSRPARARGHGTRSSSAPACGRCRRRRRRRACTAAGTRRTRRRGDRAPLRRLERLLPAGARPVDDVLVRGVARRRRRLEDAQASQVRARSAASSALQPGHAAARRRLRLGRHGAARGRAPRRARRSASRSRSRQAELAPKRVAEAGLADRVEIRVQDYRDVDDGPFDAISSIGMFEHVGAGAARRVLRPRCHGLLRPGGRLLNHGISRPAIRRPAPGPVLARGGLHRPLRVPRRRAARGRHGRARPSSRPGFEVRHVESLREHYALTLRAWVANLEARLGRGGRLESARRGRASGGSTWPRRPSSFEAGRHPDPPGARGEARRRPLGHAVAPAVGYNPADSGWVTSRGCRPR